MATPLEGPDSLDHTGLERLIERLIAGGVHGLFLLGTTGEGPALSYRLRRELISRTCAQVAGRIPVLVGITDTSVQESLSLAAHAHSAGASAVVAAPPYYFPLSQADLFRLVQRLAAAVPLPLYLYNMPSLTKVSFAPETVARAAELPNVWGFKDSSGDLAYLRAVLAQVQGHPDFAVFVGPEDLLVESVAAGAHGGVCGGANLFPSLFVSLYQAARNGDAATAARLHQKVCRLGELLYGMGEPECSYLRGLKLGLEIVGVCNSRLAEPFAAAHASQHEELGRVLKEEFS